MADMPRVSKHQVWSAIRNAKAVLDKAVRLVDTWVQQDIEAQEGNMPHPHKKKKPKK